ncbi:oxygen-independent coproporphyrinogen III oxidase, partial [Escherichia coli]|nr:oxygen-independent coproporphyrinogen III oxidase [Escherichia coli]
YYCACNKVITKHHERAGEYLDALDREIAMHREVLGSAQAVSQLHFGGGTPTFLSDAELERVMGSLRRAFRLVPGGEYS